MKRGARASSARQPVKKKLRVELVPRRDLKQVVAYVDCSECKGSSEDILNEMHMALTDAASVGCTAICVSLDDRHCDFDRFSVQ